MPVGAIIGGVGSVLGGVLGADAQKDAANKAADTSLQVAQMNNALAKDIYGQNSALLKPYSDRGNVAGNAIMALLGYPQAAARPAQAPARPGGPVGGAGRPGGALGALQAGGERPYNRFGQHAAPQQQAAAPNRPGQPARPATAVTPRGARDAFETWQDSTAYRFQLNEASKALNQNYAAAGSLQSGAAIKALQDRRQQMAQGSLMDYIGLLSNQQGVGLSGASATAGVGNNYVNNVSANNLQAGNVAANAALARGNATAGMWGGIAGGIGGALGALGSSYGGVNQSQLGNTILANNSYLNGAAFG